ncbi:MAG: hypothetical protein WBP81_11215 [Solirubrobacteraceae bacterium]
MRVDAIGGVCEELWWALPTAAELTNEGAQDTVSSPPLLSAF